MKQKRRIISLILASLLMFSMTSVALTPIEQTDMTEALYRSNVITPILSATISGSYEDIVIAPESTWIPLHDTEGTEYAYFVPMCNEKGMITGYSVIGNINGNHELLYATDKGEVDEFAISIIELYQNRNIGDRLIYSFPYAFIIGQEGSYKRIYEDNVVEKVTDISVYASNTANRLSVGAYTYQAAQPNAELLYGELDNWELARFTPMINNDSLSSSHHYGGNQLWFDEMGLSNVADQGCGLVAAANTFYYLSQNVSGKSALYTKTGITKELFKSFMLELYEYCFDFGAIAGIGTLSEMDGYVQEWADYKNVSLTPSMSDISWEENQFHTHIAAGLNTEHPVMLMTWNTPTPNLENHWVTVTRFFNNGTVKLMYASNRGRKDTFNFTEWVSAEETIHKGTIYYR